MIKIVEGFEMVGKTTFMNQLKGQSLAGLKDHLGITSMEGEYGVGYTNYWIVGAMIARLCSQGIIKGDVVQDRGILSTIAYGKLQDKNFKATGYLDKYFKDLEKAGCIIYYLLHADKDTARHYYNAALKRKDNDGVYDKFDDFNEYWNKSKEMYDTFNEIILDVKKHYPKIQFKFIITKYDANLERRSK